MNSTRVIGAALTLSVASLLAVIPAATKQPTQPVDRSAARARMIDKLKTKQTKPFDQPNEALAFYWTKRSPNGDPMSIAMLEEAAAAAADLPVHSTAAESGAAAPAVASASADVTTATLDGAWQPLGPGNIGGRSRALLIHRQSPNLMWTAGVAGGIWKSTDSGASWKPKGDLLVNIAVNSLIQDPADENILYAGTGEGFFNGDAVRGQGIFKSTDYGETWTQLASTNNGDFFFVQKLAATRKKDKGDKGKQRIYAATRTGLFRSSNGGATWTKALDATAVNGCMDIAMEEKNGYVFVSCGTFAQATVWRALDQDVQTWEPVLRELDMGRTSLALAPSNPKVVYALASFYHLPAVHPQDYALLAVYRSVDSGATWERRVHYTDANKLNTVQLTNPVYAFLKECGYGPASLFFTQGWYDNQIAVDPKDENIVWTAGIDLMRSDDGGQNWGVASYWWFDPTDPNYSHADNHAITFHPKYNGASNRQMFAASDGGVHRTDDARAAVGATLESVCGNPTPDQVRWTTLNNGYQVTQFYHGAVYPDGTRYFGGTQDNGTLRNVTAGENWQRVLGGDGGYVAVATDDTNIVYAEFTGKSLQRSTNGGASFVDISGGVTEGGGNFLFIHPFAMDPTVSSRMWYGGAFAWRSNNRGTNWTRVSNSFGARIASWGISRTDPNRVYVGVQHLGTTTSGRIFTTATATTLTTPSTALPPPGPGWSSAQPRQGYVSSIAVDPGNPLIAYATYSTYNFGTQVGHVFKTINGGGAWSRIDLTLPDMPVHSVVVHPTRPDTLYIGTDLGVFVTTDGGASWMRENTGFANVITEHLEINNGRLYAFTHGRSAWSVELAK
jgi:photosystem II stability/assembly factor-like uncharacterized protein